MREIKFRAWMEYPYLEDEDNPIYFMCYDLAFEEYEPINDLLKSVKHLMQYTGLKDKNDKEIYEGDILLWCGAKSKVEFYEESARFGANCIDEDYPLYRGTLEYHNWCDAEIIGNIYELP